MCNRTLPVGLLRHPPVTIDPALCYGRREVALACGWQDGLREQHSALQALGAARVRASTQARCREPAAWLAERLGIALQLDERLCELDFGTWEGRPWAALERPLLDAWAADPLGFRPPGGESGSELVRRVGAFCADLLAAAEPCLVVSHGGPLRLLPDLLRGAAPRLLAPAPPPGRLRIIRTERRR